MGHHASYCTFSNVTHLWTCNTAHASVCGSSTSVEAYLITFTTSSATTHWVSWVDCDQDGDADFCTKMTHGTTGGTPDVVGLALYGTPNNQSGNDDILGLMYDNEDLSAINNDAISGVASGEAGDDYIDGSRATSNYLETLYGGDHEDFIFCHEGQDVAFGGAGVDHMSGGPGVDTLQGQGDADVIFGDEDHDLLLGGDGADEMAGGSQGDDIDPGDGNDTVCGDDATLSPFTCSAESGTDGDDQVKASSGNDVIRTQGGSDKVCETNADSIYGGGAVGGGDEIHHTNSTPPAVLDCGSTTDSDNTSVTSGTSNCESATLLYCTVSF